jgi:hypothetical protein
LSLDVQRGRIPGAPGGVVGCVNGLILRSRFMREPLRIPEKDARVQAQQSI